MYRRGANFWNIRPRIFEISDGQKVAQKTAKSFWSRSCATYRRGADFWNICPRIFEISGPSFTANIQTGLSDASDRIIRSKFFRRYFQKQSNGNILGRGINTLPLPPAQGARPLQVPTPLTSHQSSKISQTSQPIKLIVGESKEKTSIYIITKAIWFSPSFTWGPLALCVS